MDIDLDLDLRGRKTKHVVAEVVGELTEADLGALAEERAIQPIEVKRLTDRHHHLARCLAAGMTNTEAAYATGYQPSRVSVLRDDPAFKNLLGHYRENVDAVYQDLHERMASLSIDAVEEIRRRLEDDPDMLTSGQLLQILEKTADRTGHAPVNRSESLHVHANLADRLDAARKRVKAMRDITPETDDDK